MNLTNFLACLIQESLHHVGHGLQQCQVQLCLVSLADDSPVVIQTPLPDMCMLDNMLVSSVLNVVLLVKCVNCKYCLVLQLLGCSS